MNNSPQEIWQAITSAKKPILTIDSRFDFDAFGSALALREVLQKMGLHIRLTYTDVIPERAFEFISADGIEQELEPSKIDFSPHDLLITIDSQDFHRASKKGEFTPPEGLKTVKIDHHGEQIYNGTLNYLRPASSACRLLYEILRANNVEIDAQTGRYLSIGLILDSGFLQQDSVDSGDYRMMAELMDVGVNVHEIYWKLGYNTPLDNVKFIQLIYKNMHVDFENKWAYSHYNYDEIKEAGINKENVFTHGGDVLKRIKGIDIAFVVKPSDSNPKDFNASFRARLPFIDVSVFAKALNKGGGHKQAASGTVINVSSIEEAILKVIEVIKANRSEAYGESK